MDPDDPNFLNNIQKLRSAYQDGDIQALEEMINRKLEDWELNHKCVRSLTSKRTKAVFVQTEE